MQLCHHDLQIELDDSWWTEAGMEGFVPATRAYRVNDEGVNGQKLFEIRIPLEMGFTPDSPFNTQSIFLFWASIKVILNGIILFVFRSYSPFCYFFIY